MSIQTVQGTSKCNEPLLNQQDLGSGEIVSGFKVGHGSVRADPQEKPIRDQPYRGEANDVHTSLLS